MIFKTLIYHVSTKNYRRSFFQLGARVRQSGLILGHSVDD